MLHYIDTVSKSVCVIVEPDSQQCEKVLQNNNKKKTVANGLVHPQPRVLILDFFFIKAEEMITIQHIRVTTQLAEGIILNLFTCISI